MSYMAARPDRAARSAAARPSDSGRPTSPTAADQLERFSGRLDRLIHDVRIGACSHRQHEAFVAEAEAIAAGVRAAFRGSATAPVSPLQARK